MVKKLLLGYDIGSSSIKACLLEAESGDLISAQFSPGTELKIESPQIGWAEQDPETWWDNLIIATKKLVNGIKDINYSVEAIGISYQMHGLVIVDEKFNVLRPSIIWCDSRAVEIGNKALSSLGADYCLGSCLNSPGNFTASKLKWVQENERELYKQIYKIMLPGDFIGMKLTHEIHTTVSGLSEGILWDFKKKNTARELINYYGIDEKLLPEVVPTFSLQGRLSSKTAEILGLKAGIPVSYRAGDQPNNALSLNVLNPGEIAATAGTSGVIYGVADKNIYDKQSRVNTFAHVNYSAEQPNVGVLLCINGTGIQYSWLKQRVFDSTKSYDEMNAKGASIKIGADGLQCFPFGNGAERMFMNRTPGASYKNINFNIHTGDHLIRASQEGIVFAFRYGLDIMKEIGMDISLVRAGDANLFKSRVFREAFVNTCNVNLELYNTDGSQGAARGAGIGSGFYSSPAEAFKGLKVIESQKPVNELKQKYEAGYKDWERSLEKDLVKN